MYVKIFYIFIKGLHVNSLYVILKRNKNSIDRVHFLSKYSKIQWNIELKIELIENIMENWLTKKYLILY